MQAVYYHITMLEFYSKNKLVWPCALVFTLIAWILNGWFGTGGKMAHAIVLSPFLDYTLGMVVCALAVYFVAELNTRFSLLPNSDRTISLTMLLLLAMSTFLHPLQGNHIVLVCSLVSYASLLDAYQSRKAPAKAFVTNLALGIASTVCPQLIWLVIANIMSLAILRAMTPKSLIASVLGIVTPYWFWGVVGGWLGHYDVFASHLAMMNTFGDGGLSILPVKLRWSFWVALLMTAVGGIDFFVNLHTNRSRTRMSYYMVCLQSAWAFLMLWREPQIALSLFPFLILNTSILWGHFTSTSKGRIQDVTLTVIMALWLITTLFIS